MTHLHLDLVGGIAGDMFIAALLDCYPEIEQELEEALDAAISAAGFLDLVTLTTHHHNDGVLTGKRFDVSQKEQGSTHHHEHAHRHFGEIQKIIQNSSLDQGVKEIALGLFQIIAEAEAQIHDKDIKDVAFHEVGAWDSIADIICASCLIHRLNITSSSCSALPLGGGLVKTAHGMLPVPAPATALILKGFEFVDDGINGERITPTGGAILKYLSPSRTRQGTLQRQGFGFGTKKLPGISNTLRVLLLDVEQSPLWQTESIHQLEFEVDDQTPEQLANAINQIQELHGVIDVIQYSTVGKKNRLGHSIRILATTNIIESIETCFKLTTTLGIRHSQVTRHILERQQISVAHDGHDYQVKLANRPGGQTHKIEMDDLNQLSSAAEQNRLRAEVELKIHGDRE